MTQRTDADVCVAVQVDANKDRLVSLSEFMESVKSERFSENEEWEVRGQPGSGVLLPHSTQLKFAVSRTDHRPKSHFHRRGAERV